MKRFFSMWGLFLSLTFLRAVAQDSGYEIYVFNQPLQAKIISKQGTVYAPAKILAQALGLNVEKKGESLCIGTISQETVNGKVILNGQTFSDIFASNDGELYVAIKPFVEASGNRIMENKETKIVDIIRGNSEKRSPVTKSDTIAANKSTTINVQYNTDLQEIEKRLSGFYTSNPGVITYMNKLEVLGSQVIKSNDKIISQFANMDTAANKKLALQELGVLFKHHADSLTKTQQEFAQITPPKEFQQSFTVLKNLVDSYYPEMCSLYLQASILINGSMKANTEQQLDAILNQLDNIFHRIDSIAEQYSVNRYSYFKAIKTELENLPRSRGPVQA